MAYNYQQYQQVPFWDFLRGFEQHGAGVDHTAPGAQPFFAGPPPPPHGGPFGAGYPPMAGFQHGFPFGGRGGWGGMGARRGGRRGRHCHHDHDGEEEQARESGPEGENAEGEGEAREGEETNEERPAGFRGRRGHGRGGPHGFGGRGGWGHRGRHGHGPHGHHGPPPFGPAPGGMGAFDLRPIFEALQNHPIGQHPWAQALRNLAEQGGLAGDGQRSGETAVPEEADSETFIPPVDVFSTEKSYILHIALPGAKKEDVGVNFDSGKGILTVAGVVYRRGDEEFLKTLTTSERKVGMFERTIKLPPGEEEKEEVDGDAITAKLEDGVLVVTVPKIEKDWTEVKTVDIE
jgi:HSP20 family protein